MAGRHEVKNTKLNEVINDSERALTLEGYETASFTEHFTLRGYETAILHQSEEETHYKPF